ncbi:MAG: dTDP-4-dehydrorhamnose reductase, partial [Candidatus Methylomirabilis sp.]|nr:dTDP-4-dehydrorhamnose reductase [Deltaproteobacteria bacterium]
MPEAAVLGAGGMLGQALRRVLPEEGVEAVFLTRAELDITNREKTGAVLEDLAPAWVVNCAAYTNVDEAEGNEALATEINGEAVGDLATSAMLAGARLLHVSTDYVFAGDGSRPYREEDPTGPLGAYGRSKLRGEEQIRRCAPEHVILRTAWLYGPGGKNFARTILGLAKEKPELKVVDDQRGSPTYTLDLARAIAGVMRSRFPGGVLHAANAGETTWFGFARRLVEAAGLRTPV